MIAIWQTEKFCEINFCIYGNWKKFVWQVSAYRPINLFQIFGTSIKEKKVTIFFQQNLYLTKKNLVLFCAFIVVPDDNQKESKSLEKPG